MIVYKYLSPNRASVLENGLIRFTQSGALNDPFETTANMRKLEESFRGHAMRMIEQAELSVLDYVIARSQVGSHVQGS
jgi:site-specific DNA-adenine methylase